MRFRVRVWVRVRAWSKKKVRLRVRFGIEIVVRMRMLVRVRFWIKNGVRVRVRFGIKKKLRVRFWLKNVVRVRVRVRYVSLNRTCGYDFLGQSYCPKLTHRPQNQVAESKIEPQRPKTTPRYQKSTTINLNRTPRGKKANLIGWKLVKFDFKKPKSLQET